MSKTIEVEGCNGEWFNLTTGDQGIYLAEEVEGAFYDPPVKVVYEEPGNYPGSRYLNHRVLQRDVTFGVEILNDKIQSHSRSWMSRDSEWRKAWAFDKDTFIHLTSESGHRKLALRLAESPVVNMTIDPNDREINKTTMFCTAGDPFWYEEDVVHSAVTRTDTQFDPSLWTPPWPWEELPSEKLSIRVHPADHGGGLNPTDQLIFPKWTVPGAVTPVPNLPWPFAPGTAIPWETAPFSTWVLPDYSFEDELHADRRLKLPGMIYKENCVIDTDPRKEQVTSESGSQVWARMNGVRFRHPIPPYTEGATFEIDASGCPPGQIVTLRLPRPWSRPWGLE